jgi:hypothetical protein
LHDGKDLCIRDHTIVVTSNIKVTLIELSKPSFGNRRLVSPINFPDVESLNLLDVGVHAHESSKGHS